MKAIVGFDKGINQNEALDSIGNKNYFEGSNIRIVIDDDTSSNLRVTNQKGNTKLIAIPSSLETNGSGTLTYKWISDSISGTSSLTASYSIGSSPYSNLNSMPTQTNMKIIGSAYIRNTIVIFTTSETGAPNGSWGQIWKFTYDSSYNANLELVYTEKLNFSTQNPIKAKGYYESEDVQKVYWVDGFNQLRFINIANPFSIDTYLGNIGILPEVTFSEPEFFSEINSGNHTVGAVQYVYNYYNIKGQQSKVSPASPIAYLGNYDDNSANTPVPITLTYKIPIVDPRFDCIRVYRLKYTSLNSTPSVTMIKDEKVNGRFSILFSDGGSVSDIASYNLEYLQGLGGEYYVATSLAEQDNQLFISDVDEQYPDLDSYDTRAYCFNNSSDAIIKQENSATYYMINNSFMLYNESGSAVTPREVDETLDCIPNDIHTAATYSDYDFKYLSDGSTLGAEGKNIKFEFVDTTMESDKTDSSLSGIGLLKSKVIDVNLNKENRFLSAEHSYKKSYKGDEIYRFGIQGYDKYGRVTPVKWCVDLRMPDLTGHAFTSSASPDVSFKQLGVKVTLKNALPSNIVGWRIVRAQRNEKDRTVLFQGIPTPTLRPNYTASVAHWSADHDEQLAFSNIPYPRMGFPYDQILTSMDPYSATPGHIFPFETDNNLLYTVDNFRINIYSPEIIFNSLKLGSEDYFNIVGNSSDSILTSGSVARFYARTSYLPTGVIEGASIATLLSTFNSTSYVKTYKWENYSAFASGSGATQVPFLTRPVICDYGINYYNSENNRFCNHVLIHGINDSTATYSQGINQYHTKCIFGTIETQLYATSGGLYNVSLASTNDAHFQPVLVDYKVSNANQYGGSSYAAKSITNYIACGNYTPSTTLTNSFWNGDIFVSFFSLLRSWLGAGNVIGVFTDTTGATEDRASSKEIVRFPVETTINIDAIEDIWLNKTGDPEQTISDWYKYNYVFQTEPVAFKYFPKPFNFKSTDNYDTIIRYSSIKRNNELIDGWSEFKVNDFYDALDESLGPITNLVEVQGNIVAVQHSGVVALSINPRASVVAQDGINLELGTGLGIQDHKYLSTTYGTTQRFGCIATGSFFYIYDDIRNKIIQNGNKPISEILGIGNFLRKNISTRINEFDNPFTDHGVMLGYDPFNHDVYFTILQGNTPTFTNRTICFNEMTQSFTSLYSFTPRCYIRNEETLFSLDHFNHSSIYIHNIGEYCKFYGQYYDSYITLILNDKGYATKVFDTLEYDMVVLDNTNNDLQETFTSIKAYNDYQESIDTPIIIKDNARRRMRQWRIHIPRDERSRIHSHWALATLTFNNANNKKFFLSNCLYSYRMSNIKNY